MKTQPTHTPTPWTSHNLQAINLDDLAFILQSVNSYEALLATVKVFKDVLESYGGVIQGGQSLFKNVERVLAKAEGK